jgi:inosine kinase
LVATVIAIYVIRRVDLNYLQGVDGPIGRCFTLISESGERTFAISEGRMNQLNTASIPIDLFDNASALVISSYLMRCKKEDSILEATLTAVKAAKKSNIPVVLTLGTSSIIAQDPKFWQQFISKYITVIAMNEDEALTGESDPLLAIDKTLEWADLVLCTAGPIGLYMAGFTENSAKRQTTLPLLPGAIVEFNRFEFSRPMKRELCIDPIKVYSHIAPYMGGPELITNTNGAGDAALAALLHDMAANNTIKKMCLIHPSISLNF